MGYEAANKKYITYQYGTVRSCYEKCEKTLKCVAFNYRHADSICWLKNSRKKLKRRVQGIEFFDLKCKMTPKNSPNKLLTTKSNERISA